MLYLYFLLTITHILKAEKFLFRERSSETAFVHIHSFWQDLDLFV